MTALASPSRYDLALLESARGGDAHAIESLLAAAQPDIRRYARRSCRNAADVDDAVQETLWLLYRRVGTLRALTSFAGWLVTVTTRACLRLARRAIGRREESAEFDDHLQFSSRPQDELRLDLARAIQSLPEHYRAVVLLRDVEELAIDEIAGQLALTREAVKARLHRARLMIREYLQEPGSHVHA
jgi:RNA polymerase sigma-70 factor (ECF subfamily)